MSATPRSAAIVPEDVRERVLRTLAGIERAEGVRVLFAVESGSRAWGFPSPDSDYDVRFVYARPRDAYLSIDAARDVIERPLVDLVDCVGWDVRKALGLLSKANPALLEWLASPCVYREDGVTTDAMRRLSQFADVRGAATYHYASLAKSNWTTAIEGRDSVKLKKYFYAIRPALALRWLRVRPGSPLPMALSALLDGVPVAAEERDALSGLIAAKEAARELGEGPRIPALDALVTGELDRVPDDLPRPAPGPATIAAFDAFLRAAIAAAPPPEGEGPIEDLRDVIARWRESAPGSPECAAAMERLGRHAPTVGFVLGRYDMLRASGARPREG